MMFDSLEAGRAGEIICLLRLAKMGVNSEIVNLGTTDIIACAYGKTFRIQVKASNFKRNSKGYGYQFCISKGGNEKTRLSEDDCDIVALVGIAQERVAFHLVGEFSDIKTKRMKKQDFRPLRLEWETWQKCMTHFGVNPPPPNLYQVPDPLCLGPSNPHRFP
jgi:hypothetical protein